MKSNARIAVLLCLVTLSAACGVAAYRYGGEEAPEEQSVAAMSFSEPKETEYFLRDRNGLVAVYYADDLSEPVTITDIETDTLNNNDRSMLQNGITAGNKTELITLLEDLSS